MLNNRTLPEHQDATQNGENVQPVIPELDHNGYGNIDDVQYDSSDNSSSEPTGNDYQQKKKYKSNMEINTSMNEHLEPYGELASLSTNPTVSAQPEEPPAREYDFSTAICMKTSDRILDDLRSDPLFLLKGDDGILSRPTVGYSKTLSEIANNQSLKYQAVFWKTKNPIFGSYKSLQLDSNTTLANFSGLLIPTNNSNSEFSNSKIFHYVIQIKYANDRINVKNSFYGFYDDQIFEEDKFFTEPDDIYKDSEFVDSQGINILLTSLPQVLDSANFISKETGTMIRIEIYPAVLSSDDLNTFNITEIQTRIATFNSEQPVENSFNHVGLTPNDCFLKFKSSLSGALKQDPNLPSKLIDLNSTKLQVMISIDILLKKFFFTLSESDGHTYLNPVQRSSLGEHSYVYEAFLQRAITETIYYISITSKNPNEVSNLLSDSFHDVFLILKEFDFNDQLNHWNNWNAQYYTESSIALSICPYYNETLIHHVYENMIAYDYINQPIYFDALVYYTTSRNSDDLLYYVTMLKGQGVLGFEELKSAFDKFGFNNLTSCSEMNEIPDGQLLNAYQNQIIVAANKYEKTTFREMLEKVAIYRSSDLLKSYLNTEPYFDVSDAYSLLEIDPSLDDSLLITFYDYKASENGMDFNPNVARAFYTIALARKSIVLMNYISNNLPQFSYQSLSITESYNYIGCLETADDLTVARVFQERINTDTGSDFRILSKALKTICDFRHSKLLEGFLTTGIVDSTLLPISGSPAGLNNIGNTCYLNSLLQYYFVIEPLRDYILGFNEVFNADDFAANNLYNVRRIGGRTVGLKETERSYQFMYQLRDLYYQLIHENDRCVTPSRELAYLAFSPISFEVEFEEEKETSANEDSMTKKTDNNIDDDSNLILESIQNEYNDSKVECSSDEKSDDNKIVDLTLDNEESNDLKPESADVIDIDESTTDDDGSIVELNNQPPKKKTAAVCKISADQFECAFEIGSQQDVTECISNVLTQIESAMKPDKLDENNEQLDMIKQLFYGKTKQRLVPVNSVTKEEIPDGIVRTKIESFLNLIVNIGDHPKDIYDALDTFFTEDLLELENEEVKRSLTISELPNILQIQIQRVQFDRVRLIPVKSNDPIPFEEKLYMDRYLETDDETVIRKRKEIFHWRRRVELLTRKREEIMKTNEQGMTIRDIMKTTRDYLKSDSVKQLGIPVDMNTLEILDLEIDRLELEISSINNELETLQYNISEQFKGFNKVGYSIFAIFIHRGQASYGHYFIYIRDPKVNVYRKYNDEIVSEVPFEEIYNFSEGNTATPYYLTFIKDELLEKITPLQRDVMIEESLQSMNKGEKELNISELHNDVD